jgi:hypothetical protein
VTIHLSVRLVWRGRAWAGHICDHPSKNAYCIVQLHNGFLGRAITSEDGPDASIDAAEIERIARTKSLLEG